MKCVVQWIPCHGADLRERHTKLDLLAFDTDPQHSFVRLPVALFAGGQAALVEFALYFPRNTLAGAGPGGSVRSA